MTGGNCDDGEKESQKPPDNYDPSRDFFHKVFTYIAIIQFGIGNAKWQSVRKKLMNKRQQRQNIQQCFATTYLFRTAAAAAASHQRY